MTWNKLILFFLLLCVVGVLFLNHLTIERQRERIATLEKQNLNLQAQLEMVHLQEQLNKSAGKVPAAAAKPGADKPAASSTGH